MLLVRILSIILGTFIVGYYSCLIHISGEVPFQIYCIVGCQAIIILMNSIIAIWDDHRKNQAREKGWI